MTRSTVAVPLPERAGAELAQGARNSLARGACGAAPPAGVDPRGRARVALDPLGEQRCLSVARGRNERDERAVTDRAQPVGERGSLDVLLVIGRPPPGRAVVAVADTLHAFRSRCSGLNPLPPGCWRTSALSGIGRVGLRSCWVRLTPYGKHHKQVVLPRRSPGLSEGRASTPV